jgi:hypothetical protein
MLSDNSCIRGAGIGQEVRGEHVFGDISKKSPLSAFELQGSSNYITLVLPHIKSVCHRFSYLSSRTEKI